MVKFKVGDRARTVYSRVGKIPVGSEVVVVELKGGIDRCYPFDCTVEYNNKNYLVKFDQLEPINQANLPPTCDKKNAALSRSN